MKMKTKIIFLIVFSLTLFFTACSESDDNSTEPTDNESASQYYPGGVGTTLAYEGMATDSNNTTTPYQREATFTGTDTQNSTEYTVQSNTITIGPSTTSGEFNFRITGSGMFIFIDPAIFQEVLDSSGIDPNLVTLTADPEIRLYAYPFADTPNWDAFVVRASALGGIVNLDLLKLTGSYQGQEQITVAGSAMTAEKIQYTATIKIPESIDQISNPETITVTAFAWFVKDVGLAKIQGSGLILSAFGSGELSFENDGGTVTETLVSYNIVE